MNPLDMPTEDNKGADTSALNCWSNVLPLIYPCIQIKELNIIYPQGQDVDIIFKIIIMEVAPILYPIILTFTVRIINGQ